MWWLRQPSPQKRGVRQHPRLQEIGIPSRGHPHQPRHVPIAPGSEGTPDEAIPLDAPSAAECSATDPPSPSIHRYFPVFARDRGAPPGLAPLPPPPFFTVTIDTMDVPEPSPDTAWVAWRRCALFVTRLQRALTICPVKEKTRRITIGKFLRHYRPVTQSMAFLCSAMTTLGAAIVKREAAEAFVGVFGSTAVRVRRRLKRGDNVTEPAPDALTPDNIVKLTQFLRRRLASKPYLYCPDTVSGTNAFATPSASGSGNGGSASLSPIVEAMEEGCSSDAITTPPTVRTTLSHSHDVLDKDGKGENEKKTITTSSSPPLSDSVTAERLRITAQVRSLLQHIWSDGASVAPNPTITTDTHPTLFGHEVDLRFRAALSSNPAATGEKMSAPYSPEEAENLYLSRHTQTVAMTVGDGGGGAVTLSPWSPSPSQPVGMAYSPLARSGGATLLRGMFEKHTMLHGTVVCYD